MTSLEKLHAAFAEGLGCELSDITDQLAYGHSGWDSVAHMAVVAAIERGFDIMLDTDDVIGMNSYAKAKEILGKYGIAFSAAG